MAEPSANNHQTVASAAVDNRIRNELHRLAVENRRKVIRWRTVVVTDDDQNQYYLEICERKLLLLLTNSRPERYEYDLHEYHVNEMKTFVDQVMHNWLQLAERHNCPIEFIVG